GIAGSRGRNVPRQSVATLPGIALKLSAPAKGGSKVSANGILPDREIAGLADTGAIAMVRPFDADQVQPASLDLRLGSTAGRVRASFLPGPATRVGDKLERLTLHEFSLENGAVLETGCVYIVPLMECLRL